MNLTSFPDERLELIFTCCHPALATEAQVALTLRTLGGDGEGLLNGFLGEVEVAEEADQRREHAAALFPESLFEYGYHSTSGRTSTAPPIDAAGTREATSMAASRSSASKKK